MIQRYLVIDAGVPELRPEPSNPAKVVSREIIILLPTEAFWELTEVVEKLRYCKIAGESPTRYWKKFVKIVPQYIAEDKDCVWFAKTFGQV